MVQKERMERGEENVNEMGGAGGEGKPFEIFGKDVTLNSSAILQNGVKAKYRLLHCSCVPSSPEKPRSENSQLQCYNQSSLHATTSYNCAQVLLGSSLSVWK